MSGTFTYSGLYALTQAQQDKVERIDEKLDKTGHTPNRYLGTDAEGNVVMRFAPSGDGTGLTPEQEQKLDEIDQKLDQSQLQEAINRALSQAQQSGLFDGKDGRTPHLSIGTVTTLSPGQKATAEITGTVDALVLNLGIPRGDAGKQGEKPVKGVDYGTPGDKMAVVSEVLKELPKWSGGAF